MEIKSIELNEADNFLLLQHKALAYLKNSFVHDLKSPLHNLYMTNELLNGVCEGKFAIEDFSKLKRYTKVIQDEVDKLDSLIQSVFNQFSFNNSIEVFDLILLIKDVTQLLETQSRHVRVPILTECESPEVKMTDIKSRLKWLLLVLCIVSLKTAKSNSSLVIEITSQDKKILIKMYERNISGDAQKWEEVDLLKNVNTFTPLEDLINQHNKKYAFDEKPFDLNGIYISFSLVK